MGWEYMEKFGVVIAIVVGILAIIRSVILLWRWRFPPETKSKQTPPKKRRKRKRRANAKSQRRKSRRDL